MDKGRHLDKSLRDLLNIIQFTEDVTTRIHGVQDEAEVYSIVKGAFAKSKRYTASITLLTDDGSSLRVAENSLTPHKLKAVEKALGIRLQDYKIDLNKSSIYRQVVREGKTIKVKVSDIIGELFPQPLAHLISRITGYARKSSILTPLHRHGEIIGAFAMSSTELAEHFIPAVKNLARHISTALEMADKHAKGKQAEEALRQSEEKYRTIFENTGTASIIINGDTTISLINSEFEKLSGFSKEEVEEKKSWTEFALKEDLEHLMEYHRLRKIDQGTAPRNYETRMIDKHGNVKHVLLTVSLIPGTIQRVVSILDITERKRDEENLHKSEEHYRLLAENAADVIWTVDMNMRLTYVSSSVTRLLGYSVEEAMTKTMEEVFTTASFEIAKKTLAEKMAAEEKEPEGPAGSLTLEVELNRKDGSVVPVELRCCFLREPDGRPASILAIARDITERRRMEDERKELISAYQAQNQSLTNFQQELEKALAKTKQAEEKMQSLYEREKKLRKKLEIEMAKRTEFTRALVHELRTPLTPVMASSELMVDLLKDEPWLSIARNINRGASNLNRRIDELLDLARGEIGMLKLQPKWLLPLKLIREVVADMTQVASSRGQSLLMDLPPSLPRVWADEARLRQVMLNLLSNACKFTPEGGSITIRAKEDNGNLVVEVKDTGPGVTEEEQLRLFQPYHRTERDRERLSGLGLGLALSKTLVELHKGQIWVESKRGEGAAFSFSLPLNGASQRQEDPKKEG